MKYNVPVIDFSTDNVKEGLTLFTRSLYEKFIKEYRITKLSIPINGYCTRAFLLYIKEDELFSNIIVRAELNPEMLKTYICYIELRGE